MRETKLSLTVYVLEALSPSEVVAHVVVGRDRDGLRSACAPRGPRYRGPCYWHNKGFKEVRKQMPLGLHVVECTACQSCS